MKNQHIHARWLSFLEAVGLANTHAEQKREMRRAFYAGAQGLLGLQMAITQARLETGEDTDEAELKILTEIADELREFSEQVLAGRV